jgi:hypothetical protein
MKEEVVGFTLDVKKRRAFRSRMYLHKIVNNIELFIIERLTAVYFSIIICYRCHHAVNFICYSSKLKDIQTNPVLNLINQNELI